jgi:ATP-binding cassette subfamily C protein LapB
MNAKGASAMRFGKVSRHWLWSLLWQDKKLWLYALLATAMLNAFSLVVPFFTMAVYDRVLPTQSLDSLTALSIGVLIALVFEQIIRILRTSMMYESEKRIDAAIGDELVAAMTSLSDRRSGYSAGHSVNAMQTYPIVRRFLSRATTLAIGELPFALFILWIIAAFAGWQMAFWPFAAAMILLLVAKGLSSLHAHHAEGLSHLTSRRNAFLSEIFQHLGVLRCSAPDSFVGKQWRKLQSAYLRSEADAQLLQERGQQFANLLRSVAVVGLLITGVQLVIEAKLSAGALIACMMLSQRLFQILACLFGLLLQSKQAQAMMQMIDAASAIDAERTMHSKGIRLPQLQANLRLREVNAGGERDMPTLRGISFDVRAGEKIAIVGRNGAGKSTLLRAIMGLEQCWQGQIQVDGVVQDNLDMADFRRRTGYAEQSPGIFNTSIRDNICLRDPSASDAAIHDALQLSGFSDICAQSGSGVRTIGEQGLRLSGGQRQSLVLARALLNRPSLLLLDEPSSHLDKAAEMQMLSRWRNALDATTLIMVTHRMSMLALVDRVIVMEAGRISLDGPKSLVLARLGAENVEQFAS